MPVIDSLEYDMLPNGDIVFTLKALQEQEREYFSPVFPDGDGVWGGDWINANAYLRYYKPGSTGAYHTGADLNLNKPQFDADAHSPVYSMGDGVVYAVRQLSGWGTIICIRHKDVLSRYAHVENVLVKEGQVVKAKQQIASIGNAGGRFPYHLHFDIAKLDARMATVPGDWPGINKDRVLRDYIDPEEFFKR